MNPTVIIPAAEIPPLPKRHHTRNYAIAAAPTPPPEVLDVLPAVIEHLRTEQ